MENRENVRIKICSSDFLLIIMVIVRRYYIVFYTGAHSSKITKINKTCKHINIKYISISTYINIKLFGMGSHPRRVKLTTNKPIRQFKLRYISWSRYT